MRIQSSMQEAICQSESKCEKAILYAIWKGDLMPSDSEFVILEEYIATVKPKVEITEAIGGGKWVTISTVRPDYLECKNLDSKLKRDMKIPWQTILLDDMLNQH